MCVPNPILLLPTTHAPQYGGIYADVDVECLRPIDEWNAEHNHDAAMLLGVESFNAKRQPHRIHVASWTFAAMPGHPLLTFMPWAIAREVQRQYFALARNAGTLSRKLYEDGLVDRTGPAALTTAMYEYFNSIEFDLNQVSEDTDSQQGVVAGAVRVLPWVAMGTGWDVAAARQRRREYTCSDVRAAQPEALTYVCHHFFGSWRSQWGPKQVFTYNCAVEL